MEGQGNIKFESNSAQTGMNQDQTLNQIKPGTLTYALNAAVENFDSSSVNYQNEQGNEFSLKFPDNFVLIGTHFINEKNKHVFFLTNPETKYCEIGYMLNNDNVYRKLVGSNELGWDIRYPIHKIVHKITNCTTEIYWPDNITRRYMDIDNPPYKLAPTSGLCKPEYTQELDCNQLSIQPNFSIPSIEVSSIQSGGGNISAGTVQFAIQYSDAASNPYTSYYSVTNPTPIADPIRTTVNFDYVVSKSVVLDIKNLDTTGQFSYYNLAVLKTVNAITSVELVGTYFIDNTNKTEIYTGQSVDNIRLSIKDIFEKFPYYDKASDITTAQDVLIWSGLSSVDRANYQSIASKITLGWETYAIPPGEDYSDELNATNLRGFLRDEVFPAEIVFLLKNGKQTDGFHIPGRELSTYDKLKPDVSELNPDFVGTPTYYNSENVGFSPYWKIYNTATVTGTYDSKSSNKIGNATQHQYGEFAYWESSDVYPCNVDVWGELANKPIRHHKFPDVLVAPISSPVVKYNGKFTTQESYKYPIGIKIDNEQVKALINESNLTKEQKDAIQGYKIIRGDRATNKSIIGKGMLRNMNTYTRENQTFLYSNYPYNDLNDDPFIDSNNNAWSALAAPYTIDIYQLNLPESSDTKTYVEILYTSPNSNKVETIRYTSTGSKKLCSITRPVAKGPGIKNLVTQSAVGPFVRKGSGTVINISNSNYDIYKITRCGNKGLDVGFDDITMGYTTGRVAADISFSGALNQYVVHVKEGTTPVKTGGNGSICYTLLEKVRANECGPSVPLPGIKSSDIKPYRQIFNSPETSFAQPFLGNVLKIENVMYGAGSAHFVEVNSNAKYRLLTKEAQEDALDASSRLGSLSNPFSAAAMFSAYQAYLQIYINGITRRNYANSFNSTASYDYNHPVQNSGNKQRTLDISRYLIPGVQNVGDKYNINNYNRESSVFLKTSENKESLIYPSNVESLPQGVTDFSRFTISGSGACSTPAQERDISVVSYYASLKNVFTNQWGQIYTYNTVDTGLQVDIRSSGSFVAFGGDTFIGKFGYKTKLPFFTDNRVNAPDDSDIFYDEIGNIAYPKYWHSARSILKDFQGNGSGVLSNIISYKAHNFDCPNSQVLIPFDAPKDTNPGRTYYDGYFYLFAYGLPSFYCESSYNVDLRQATNNREGDFWPHVSSGIPDDWFQEDFVSIRYDNTYNYNTTFSKQNKENNFTHLPPDWTSRLCETTYPFRAVYSDSQNIDSDNKVNSWLTYKAVSYYDFPQNFGKLISLDGIQNKAILASFENKTLMYNNLLTIDTSNPQSAYIGNPNMFKGAPPVDFADTDLGYVGTQNKMLLKIPQGQIKVDAKRGQVFLIDGTAAQDISAFGSGMNRFFTDNLAFNILKKFPNVNTDNNFNGIGLHGVYDSKFERVLLTKLDYQPLREDIQYDPVTNEYYIEEQTPDTITP